MTPLEQADAVIRFQGFELNPQTGELRKEGIRLKIQDQPLKVLVALLQHPGQMVTREELRQLIWPEESFGDFDHAINLAITKLRSTLGDSADVPHFIETLPRRGYRFIASVESGRERVSKTSFEKEPEKRYRSAKELVVDLRRLTTVAKQHKFGMATAVFLALAMLAAATYGIYALVHRAVPAPFQDFTITQLTNNGKTVAAAISPDGKYLLSALDESGKQSLWLRHLPTNSETQVLPSTDTSYQGLIFSPDGNYVYFGKLMQLGYSDLFRAPVLGDTPQPIVRNVDSGISFSSNGKRIVFVRENDPDAVKFQVLTANVDGTDAKMLFGGSTSECPLATAWSPDGKQIASLLPNARGSLSTIELVDTSSVKMQTLSQFKNLGLTELVWLPDGGGLLTTYQSGAGHGPPPSRLQIGLITYPGGQFRPITKDISSYKTLSLSADGKTLVAVQQRSAQTLYLLPASGFAGTPPAPAAAQSKDSYFFDWAKDGEIYFDGNIVRVAIDGSNRTTLLSDPAERIFRPTPCPIDRYIVFAWQGHPDPSKITIWRIDADGANLKQLSHGEADVEPFCSADARWVFYTDVVHDQVIRVSIEGGDSEVVPGTVIPGMMSVGLGVSRDGKFLAFQAFKGGPEEPASTAIAVVSLLGGSEPARLVTPDSRIARQFGGEPHFAPDGKSFVYIIHEHGADNLWLQPLDGSRGRQITNFPSDRIQNYEYSPDGKTLGVMRSHTESDVVLLRDTASLRQ